MTFDQIISDLYISPDLDRCIAKQVRREDWDDFKQELFTIICGLDKEMVVKLHGEMKLKYYVVRIVINLSRQSNNKYKRTYQDKKMVYGDMAEVIHPAEHNTLQERIEAERRELMLVDHVEHHLDDQLGTKFPYYRTLVKLIAEKGSIREVSRMTGIPAMSISDSMKKVRKHLLTI